MDSSHLFYLVICISVDSWIFIVQFVQSKYTVYYTRLIGRSSTTVLILLLQLFQFWALRVLSVDSCVPVTYPTIVCARVGVHGHFLVLQHYKMLQDHHIYSQPYNESCIQGVLVIFWRTVLDTRSGWQLSVLLQGITASRSSRLTARKCACACVCAHARVCVHTSLHMHIHL